MAKDLTKELTELTVQTVREAKNTDQNSEEYGELLNSIERLTKLVIESEKIDIERKKIEKESDLDKKYLIDIAVKGLEQSVKYTYFALLWGGIMQLEQTGAISSSPGRLMMSAFKPQSIL